jgi:hypothetical protein
MSLQSCYQVRNPSGNGEELGKGRVTVRIELARERINAS